MAYEGKIRSEVNLLLVRVVHSVYVYSLRILQMKWSEIRITIKKGKLAREKIIWGKHLSYEMRNAPAGVRLLHLFHFLCWLYLKVSLLKVHLGENTSLMR